MEYEKNTGITKTNDGYEWWGDIWREHELLNHSKYQRNTPL
jgi:Mn-dependent DtxR family transcriptional regulator